jgi:hypothetical protein
MKTQRRSKWSLWGLPRTGNHARGPAVPADGPPGVIQPLCLSGPGTFLVAGHLRLQLHGPARR